MKKNKVLTRDEFSNAVKECIEKVEKEMTLDEIVKLAEKTKLFKLFGQQSTDLFSQKAIQRFEDYCVALEQFATLVAAHEREECAKVCETIAQQMFDEGEGPTGYIGWVDDCTNAIRARGQE